MRQSSPNGGGSACEGPEVVPEGVPAITMAATDTIPTVAPAGEATFLLVS